MEKHLNTKMLTQTRLAIVTTHPIQYNAPLFKCLSQYDSIQVKVFYTWNKSEGDNYDPGFGKKIQWDIPLLNNYVYTFVKNTSKKPGSFHFTGIKNPTLIKEIEEWGANTILIYGWAFQSHLKALHYFKGKIPVFFRGDSHLLNETQGLKRILRRLILILIYRYIDIAFYVGTNNKNYYLANKVNPKKLIWVPHAVDNTFFQENYMDNEAFTAKLKTSLGIQKSDFIILFVGKLEPKKNPEILIKAINKLNRKDVHLIMVGSGILESSLKSKFQNNTNLHFLGFQNQTVLPKLYKSSNILCLPSCGPGETWGLTVNEAMACGLPIIISDKVGCAIDLVKDNYNGFIFESNNLDDLINCIIKCLNKDVLERMGENSRNIIKDWSIEFAAEKIVNTLLINRT